MTVDGRKRDNYKIGVFEKGGRKKGSYQDCKQRDCSSEGGGGVTSVETEEREGKTGASSRQFIQLVLRK